MSPDCAYAGLSATGMAWHGLRASAIPGEQVQDSQVDANPAAEDVRKHLELIQAVVDRLARTSFLVKGWALTVAAAIFGVAASQSDWRVSTIGFLPALGFWSLDAYYLYHERLFRCLYDGARKEEVPIYSMDTSMYKSRSRFRRALFSVTLVMFYGLILSFAGLLVYSLSRPA